MNKCYTCIHRRSVPGDAHSCCKYPGTNTDLLSLFSDENLKMMKQLNIRANPHGIEKGWFLWPINFDPVWLENCDGYQKKEEETNEL